MSTADMAAYEAYVEALRRWVDAHAEVLENAEPGDK